tara:strand:+ start:1947 stop:2222 length:276 start_codon:yes stop_codon:yes gene_type:complete
LISTLPSLPTSIGQWFSDSSSDKDNCEQVKQIKSLPVLPEVQLQKFCRRLIITGTGIGLEMSDAWLRQTIASWSAYTDIVVKAKPDNDYGF